ncbi:MAG: hypothetical protein WCA35_14225 [Kovacikia sp.]
MACQPQLCQSLTTVKPMQRIHCCPNLLCSQATVGVIYVERVRTLVEPLANGTAG